MASDTYTIKWRPLAVNDLLEIIRFIAEDNPSRARSFGAELRTQVEQLPLFPLRGRGGRIAGSRELVIHTNYIVIYRVKPRKQIIEILRLKHAAQQWP